MHKLSVLGLVLEITCHVLRDDGMAYGGKTSAVRTYDSATDFPCRHRPITAFAKSNMSLLSDVQSNWRCYVCADLR